MIDLMIILKQRTWRELYMTAHAHHLPFNSHHTREELVTRLYKQLVSDGALQQVLTGCGPREMAALAALQAAEGSLPLHIFTETFGPIRPYRPWTEGADRQPWKNPASPAEYLWQRAMIGTLPGADGTPDQVCMPVEVSTMLPPLPQPESMRGPRFTSTAALSPTTLLTDVSVLLGTLLHDDVRPRWGRWLPLKTIRALNVRLFATDDLKTCRSELQTTRIRFLHYLAEAAGLLSVQGEWLKPTVTGWHWLGKPPEERWQLLWDAWQADLGQNVERLWDVYRLPPVTSHFWMVLVKQLSELSAGTPYEVDSLALALRPYLPDVENIEEPLTALLCGPLHWVGLLTADESQLVILPAGEACLNGNTANAFSPVGDAVVALEENRLRIMLPSVPRSRPLVKLLSWASVDADGLFVDAEAVVRAMRRGYDIQDMAAVPSELTGHPLPSEVLNQLQRWQAERVRLKLHHVLVLTSPDAELLTTIRGKRSLRDMFSGPISPHHLTVRSAKREELLRRLDRIGHAVQFNAAANHGEAEHSDALPPEMAAYLWLAVRVYRDLSAFVPQAVSIPASVLDGLSTSLNALTVDELAQTARDMIEDLQQAVEGYAPLASPVADVNVEEVWNKLSVAQEAKTALIIDYFSAGKRDITRRTIEPIMLTERGGARYVEAWCQLAEAVRTFRVDRIVRIIEDVP